jgi:hypothetical protein
MKRLDPNNPNLKWVLSLTSPWLVT